MTIIPRRLNIGCGEHYANGWLNIDIVENDQVQPDLVLDFRDNTFEDRYFDQVYLGHVLEHFPKNQVLRVLKEVHRVLRYDGEVACVGPSYTKAKAMHAKGRVGDALLRQIEKGEGRWEGDVHYWLPDDDTVVKYLTKAGFVGAHEVEWGNLRGWPVVATPNWQHKVLAYRR